MSAASSSTSSSERSTSGLHALLLIVRAAVPTLALVGATLAIAAYSHLQSPAFTREQEPNFVDALIETQIERANTLPATDILIVGDSSALMDIDPARLARLTGQSAETLATIAYGGPRAMASLIDRMARRGARPRTLILAFHAAGMPRRADWEDWTMQVVAQTRQRPFASSIRTGALGRLNDLTSGIVFRPLEGAYGSFYGGREQFVDYLREHHGSAIDPRPRDLSGDELTSAALQWAVSFETTDLFRADLPTLRAAIERLAPARVRLLITPVPQRWALPQALENRSAAIREITEALGLAKGDLLDTPAYLPTRSFAVETHLHESARPLFTQSLAAALAGRSPN